MAYAIIKDNQLITYPYWFEQFQLDNPYTNYGDNKDFVALFPNTEIGAQGYELVSVANVGKPTVTFAQNLDEGTPVLVNNIWTQVWNITEKSADEISSINAERSATVRSVRNVKLSACDWTQVSDAPVDKAAWATYRQALRDLPKETGFPWTMTWPTDPNGNK